MGKVRGPWFNPGWLPFFHSSLKIFPSLSSCIFGSNVCLFVELCLLFNHRLWLPSCRGSYGSCCSSGRATAHSATDVLQASPTWPATRLPAPRRTYSFQWSSFSCQLCIVSKTSTHGIYTHMYDIVPDQMKRAKMCSMIVCCLWSNTTPPTLATGPVEQPEHSDIYTMH